MKVSELILELQQLPQNLNVMKARDDEGNGYLKVDDLAEMMYRKSSGWDGECCGIEDWEEEMKEDDNDENNWERVIVIW